MRSPRFTFASLALVSAIGVFLIQGCASNREAVSMRTWQADLQQHVNTSGNGDMNTLRATQVTADRPGFRAFSNDRTEDSDEIAGVLIGATEHGGRLWYLYLVGETSEQRVRDIHAVAVSQHALKYQWREGPRDPAALASYQAHLDKTWRAAHPDHAQPPRGSLAFPSSADVFEYIARGDMITIREKTSGAEWNVDLTHNAPDQD
jgi:hypothetical protein